MTEVYLPKFIGQFQSLKQVLIDNHKHFTHLNMASTTVNALSNVGSIKLSLALYNTNVSTIHALLQPHSSFSDITAQEEIGFIDLTYTRENS